MMAILRCADGLNTTMLYLIWSRIVEENLYNGDYDIENLSKSQFNMACKLINIYQQNRHLFKIVDPNELIKALEMKLTAKWINEKLQSKFAKLAKFNFGHYQQRLDEEVNISDKLTIYADLHED